MRLRLPPAICPGALLGLLLGAVASAGASPLPTGQTHELTAAPQDLHPTAGPAGAEVRVDLLLNVTDPQARHLIEAAERVRTRLRGEARLVYRLHGGRHAATPLVMRALWAAHLQGRFLPLLEEVMPGRQPSVSNEIELERRARSVGLDLVRLRKDAFSSEVRQQMAADRRFAARFGLESAAFGLIINGQPIQELAPEVIDEAVATAQREARELHAGGTLSMDEVHARLHDRHGKPEPGLPSAAPARTPPAVLTRSNSRTGTAADSTLALLGPLPQPTVQVRPTYSSRRRIYSLGHLSGLRRHAPDTTQAPRRGPARAKVKVVVFADFIGDDSVRLAASLRRVMGEFGGRVQLAFMHYPGYLHRSVAFRVAEVAIAAHAQGCFWGFHDKVYGVRQRRGQVLPLPPDFAQGLEKTARQAGCKAGKLTAELASGGPRRRLYADMAQASAVPLWRSPGVILNGRLIGTPDLALLRQAVKEELKKR